MSWRDRTVIVDVLKRDQFTPEQEAALLTLSRAVYPPSEPNDAAAISWAPTVWRVLVWDEAGRLVSHVGVLVRDATYNGQPVRLGGIGGVQTHPDARGKGYASAALSRAAQVLRDTLEVDFSQLVCRPALLSYYARLGWQPFGGDVYVDQPTGRQIFTFNRTMLLSGRIPAPQDGVLDLCGLPW